MPAITDIRRRGFPAPHAGQAASATLLEAISVSNWWSQPAHLNSYMGMEEL